jgi:light-harvesting protein B-800-850 alpha chain
MYHDVLNYKPSESDYRIWKVVDPKIWLIPILITVLLIALAVHSFVYTSDKYNFLGADEAPVAEVVPAAPATAPAE